MVEGANASIMGNNDISLIIKILKKGGRGDLAKLLDGAQGYIDESSTYGTRLFSTLSRYLFYLPLENYLQIREIPASDKEVLLNSVLCLYPHQERAPEIQSVDFRILKKPQDFSSINIGVDLIDHEFAKEQLEKCDKKIREDDYDGAISSAGSLLEGVFDDIHKKCTSRPIGDTADLNVAYKKIKSLLRLSDEQYSNESIKGILRSLSAVISGLDNLRNQLGDRHKRLGKPWERHANLCVNSAKVIIDFLYETLGQQETMIKELCDGLIRILDSEKRFMDKDVLASDPEVLAHMAKHDEFLKESVKNTIIDQYKIERFRDSDIFFAAMLVFFEQLNENDINRIFKKHKDNNQACGLVPFLNIIAREKRSIINKDVILLLEKQPKAADAVSDEDLPF